MPWTASTRSTAPSHAAIVFDHVGAKNDGAALHDEGERDEKEDGGQGEEACAGTEAP